MLRPTEGVDGLSRCDRNNFVDGYCNAGKFVERILEKLTGWAVIIAVPTGITGCFGPNIPFPALRPSSRLLDEYCAADRTVGRIIVKFPTPRLALMVVGKSAGRFGALQWGIICKVGASRGAPTLPCVSQRLECAPPAAHSSRVKRTTRIVCFSSSICLFSGFIRYFWGNEQLCRGHGDVRSISGMDC